jgi:hypothetical protein
VPHHVDVPHQSEFGEKPYGIHDVKGSILVSQLAQNVQCLQALFGVVNLRFRGIQKEGPTAFQVLHHVELVSLYVGLIVACHVTGLAFLDSKG